MRWRLSTLLKHDANQEIRSALQAAEVLVAHPMDWVVWYEVSSPLVLENLRFPNSSGSGGVAESRARCCEVVVMQSDSDRHTSARYGFSNDPPESPRESAAERGFAMEGPFPYIPIRTGCSHACLQTWASAGQSLLHVHMGRAMKPKEIVERWVEYFNKADIDGLCSLYHIDAINHQVVTEPLEGIEAIRSLFETDFGRADMHCVVETIHEAGDWAILEWKDPLGLRGCGFFQVREGKIALQRGYFDQITFFRAQGLGVPDEYLNV